jgi:TfoX/Sxy family transcriptional regulator of competence genes
MAANEQLLKKLREAFKDVSNVEEKKMFSGVAFMVNNKLCVTVGKDKIMCRINPDLHDELIQNPGCTTVVMKGKEYKGYIWISESALTSKKEISHWVKLALDFNPKSKASKKPSKNNPA